MTSVSLVFGVATVLDTCSDEELSMAAEVTRRGGVMKFSQPEDRWLKKIKSWSWRKLYCALWSGR